MAGQKRIRPVVKRTNLNLTDVDMRHLGEIRDFLGCTEAEAMRRALRLTGNLIRVQEAGGSLIIQNSDGRERILLV